MKIESVGLDSSQEQQTDGDCESCMPEFVEMYATPAVKVQHSAAETIECSEEDTTAMETLTSNVAITRSKTDSRREKKCGPYLSASRKKRKCFSPKQVGSDDSDAEEELTPPDTLDTTAESTNSLLSEKSRRIYDTRYRRFMEWRTAKNTEVLLEYFQELSGNSKSSTLWTFYSMLKSTLHINHQVDISKYTKLMAFLKKFHKLESGKVKKSKTFSPDDINKFLNEAPDEIYLSIKVALIFGLMGACRRQELHGIQFRDVHVLESKIVVIVSTAKSRKNRSFTITGRYYELCKKYIGLRPDPCTTPAFFINYKYGKCQALNVGINKFGTIGKSIASYLHLPHPELYTGHCFRRTSATLLIDADGDITALKRHGGWLKPTVAEGCNEDSMGSVSSVESNI